MLKRVLEIEGNTARSSILFCTLRYPIVLYHCATHLSSHLVGLTLRHTKQRHDASKLCPAQPSERLARPLHIRRPRRDVHILRQCKDILRLVFNEMTHIFWEPGIHHPGALSTSRAEHVPTYPTRRHIQNSIDARCCQPIAPPPLYDRRRGRSRCVSLLFPLFLFPFSFVSSGIFHSHTLCLPFKIALAFHSIYAGITLIFLRHSRMKHQTRIATTDPIPGLDLTGNNKSFVWTSHGLRL